MAVYNNLLAIFPQNDYVSLTAALSFVSGDDPVRNFLLELGELFPVGDLSSHDTVVLGQQLAQLGMSDLHLLNLGDKELDYLSGLSAENKAELYALLHLNSFVVTGDDSIYSSLDLDPANFSTQYLADRAEMLFWKMQIATTDAAATQTSPYTENGAPEVEFQDRTNRLTLTLGDPAGGYEYRRRVLFGSAGMDTLIGASKDDQLFGGDGNDFMGGGDGNDYLEGGEGQDSLNGGAEDDTLVGGEGNDIYVFGANHGHDTLIDIREADGFKHGILRYVDDNLTLTATGPFDQVEDEPNTWRSAEGLTLEKGTTWILTTPGGSVDLGADFISGDFGIELAGRGHRGRSGARRGKPEQQRPAPLLQQHHPTGAPRHGLETDGLLEAARHAFERDAGGRGADRVARSRAGGG
jgi:hypothetical protein